MIFKHNRHTHMLRGLEAGYLTIISSHIMENILEKGHHGLFSQFNAIQSIESIPTTIHLDLKQGLDHRQQLFEKPKDLPPSRGENDHNIPLILGSQLPNVHCYRYPFAKNDEIEKIFHEILEVIIICPNTNPYSSLVVMVLKKHGKWCMCPDFRTLNKLTIKDNFPFQ